MAFINIHGKLVVVYPELLPHASGGHADFVNLLSTRFLRDNKELSILFPDCLETRPEGEGGGGGGGRGEDSLSSAAHGA